MCAKPYSYITFVIIIIFAAAVTAKQKAMQSKKRPTTMSAAEDLNWDIATINPQ